MFLGARLVRWLDPWCPKTGCWSCRAWRWGTLLAAFTLWPDECWSLLCHDGSEIGQRPKLFSGWHVSMLYLVTPWLVPPTKTCLAQHACSMSHSELHVDATCWTVCLIAKMNSYDSFIMIDQLVCWRWTLINGKPEVIQADFKILRFFPNILGDVFHIPIVLGDSTTSGSDLWQKGTLQWLLWLFTAELLRRGMWCGCDLHAPDVWLGRCWNHSGFGRWLLDDWKNKIRTIWCVTVSRYGSVSKPCTPGEHQNSW